MALCTGVSEGTGNRYGGRIPTRQIHSSRPVRDSNKDLCQRQSSATSVQYSLLGAWSPEYQQQQDWQQWQSSNCALDDSDRIAPKLPQVAAMQRRRFSRLSKMMLEAAFQAEAPSQCRSVFASRHGELNRTIELLQDIIARQPLSPMGFSQSVHNTASGLFGIVTGNTGASTSVAAGTDTLSQAMLEAWAQLAEDPSPCYWCSAMTLCRPSMMNLPKRWNCRWPCLCSWPRPMLPASPELP